MRSPLEGIALSDCAAPFCHVRLALEIMVVEMLNDAKKPRRSGLQEKLRQTTPESARLREREELFFHQARRKAQVYFPLHFNSLESNHREVSECYHNEDCR